MTRDGPRPEIASHWGLLRPRPGKSRGVRTREGARKAGVVRPQPGCAPDGRGGPPAKTFDATTVEELGAADHHNVAGEIRGRRLLHRPVDRWRLCEGVDLTSVVCFNEKARQRCSSVAQ